MAIMVDIGVFAHNEGRNIASVIAQLAAQTLLDAKAYDVRLVVLANGCTDDTIARASQACAPHGFRMEVLEIEQGGKSRTWNTFVHQESRPNAELLFFCDADIEIPEPDALQRLVDALVARPKALVMNSQPIKDIVHRPQKLNRVDRFIALGAGTLDDWKTAICGQLYVMRSPAARGIYLPIGLPVEDGFLRAMVLTDCLTGPETKSRIDGADGVYHVYQSERRVLALIRHQTRIIIGSAINSAAFVYLHSLPADAHAPELARAAGDERWLARIVRKRLPRFPSAYVPGHFLIKRSAKLLRQPGKLRQPKRLLLLIGGFCFDLIVYVNAQIRMLWGTGVGHW